MGQLGYDTRPFHPATRMQALFELLPVVAFFVAYFLKGLYVATAVLMAGMALLIIADWLSLRRIPGMHGLSAALVFVFGAATLALHDKSFIQWKPTVFFWLLALAFLASLWMGERPLVQRLFGKALGASEPQVAPAVWRRLTWQWVGFYAALGALNLWVAYRLSERAWVNFKIIDFFITLAFVAGQLTWLMRRAPPQESTPTA